MPNYQIKLTPVDSYFFGGEKHTRNEKNELKANYFVESNHYPQQTTLLGFIRYLLLTKTPDLLKTKSIDSNVSITKLIGSSSFNYNKPPEKYGKIVYVSSLYFEYKNEIYQYAPFDFGFELSGDLQLSLKGKKYNAKDHHAKLLCQKLVNAKGAIVDISDIILDVPQVGNEKADIGETKDNKFYKQTSKRIKDGWSFCVDVELIENCGIINKDILYLPFGGEKSYFKVEILERAKTSFRLPPNYIRNTSYIFCLSDCFVDSSVLGLADFAVNNYVSFRNLQSKVNETKKYSGLSDTDPEQMKRSERFNLMQRGSVLFFKKEENLQDAIKKFKNNNCENIGFNHIIIHS